MCCAEEGEQPRTQKEIEIESMYTDLLSVYLDFKEYEGLSKAEKEKKKIEAEKMDLAGKLSTQAAIGAQAQQMLNKMATSSSNGNNNRCCSTPS